MTCDNCANREANYVVQFGRIDAELSEMDIRPLRANDRRCSDIENHVFVCGACFLSCGPVGLAALCERKQAKNADS